MNQYSAVGRLTKDPELKYTTGGTAVCRIRLAVPGMGRAEQGQQQPGFINVSQYGPGAEAAGQWLKQGSLVAVDGRMEWRTWTGQDDVRRETHEVVGDIQFLADLRTPEERERDSTRDRQQEADAEAGRPGSPAPTPGSGAVSEMPAAARSVTAAAGSSGAER
jgi:single-strand DNA-binding protein